MSELRNCPFCGGKVKKSTMKIAPINVYDCQSPDCGACITLKSPNNYQPKNTDKHWNNRPDNWISVKDRLPTVDPRYGDIDVLVYMDDGFIATTTFSGDWELWAESGEVTHWQPLPNPPKQKGNI